jgi:hypothetical protein
MTKVSGLTKRSKVAKNRVFRVENLDRNPRPLLVSRPLLWFRSSKGRVHAPGEDEGRLFALPAFPTSTLSPPDLLKVYISLSFLP